MNVTDSQLASLSPVYAAALDIAISGLLELKPNADRRVYVAIDEFAMFGYINSLEALLTKGRKCGGCAIFGVQTISQPREAYTFASWYNDEQRYSAIGFVTSAQRHAGLDAGLLRKRIDVYEAAKKRHLER